MRCFLFAGPRGIEPRPTVLETDVLPLNYGPNMARVTEVETVGKGKLQAAFGVYYIHATSTGVPVFSRA